MIRGVAAVCGLALPALAAADVRFGSLPPDGVRTELSTRLGIHLLDDADPSFYSLQLEGQYVGASALGGYARLSAAKFDRDTEVGDLELGGTYRVDHGDELAFTVRGGLALPTATGEPTQAYANAYALVLTRPGDLATARVGVTTLRLATSATYRHGALVLRGDFGFDLPVDVDAQVEDELGEPPATYHADLAAALRSGPGAGTLELSSSDALDHRDGDGEVRVITVGGQYDADGTTVSVAIATPFRSDPDQRTYTVLFGVGGPL